MLLLFNSRDWCEPYWNTQLGWNSCWCHLTHPWLSLTHRRAWMDWWTWCASTHRKWRARTHVVRVDLLSPRLNKIRLPHQLYLLVVACSTLHPWSLYCKHCTNCHSHRPGSKVQHHLWCSDARCDRNHHLLNLLYHLMGWQKQEFTVCLTLVPKT